MNPLANIFAFLVFFGWIPIALWGARRWPPAKAASFLLLTPLMFLPDEMYFKLPGLLRFGKDSLAIFWFLVGVLAFHRKRLVSIGLSTWIKTSILLVVGGCVVTVLVNLDPVSIGPVYLEGHTPYDAVHTVMSVALSSILPFVLAAVMFRTSQDLRTLFRLLVGAALVYSAFQLVEIRLSPQLHRWFYGYYQHSFEQTKRGDGFRPIVFMEHGLAVAMFTFVSVLGASALCKAKIKVFRVNAAWVSSYLWLILLLSKSLAAFLYSIVAVPLVGFFSPRVQFRVAATLALVLLSYPTLRSLGMVPVDYMNEVATDRFGAERAGSMMYRLNHEEKLLERANERPLFGWGTYCRWCTFDSWTGAQTSVSDGDWIITYAQFGVVGFFGKYLLLTLPILIAARKPKRAMRLADRRLLAALALMVAFSAFDLILNGNFNYLAFALSGALFGCSRGIVLEAAYLRRAKRLEAIEQKAKKPV